MEGGVVLVTNIVYLSDYRRKREVDQAIVRLCERNPQLVSLKSDDEETRHFWQLFRGEMCLPPQLP